MLTSNVRKIMEEKKVTIRAMGAKTGLSGETITRARGREIIQCRLMTLESIAKCLDCKIKDLFDEA
jgi:DNA-binding Xre family transcriptional regulator